MNEPAHPLDPRTNAERPDATSELLSRSPSRAPSLSLSLARWKYALKLGSWPKLLVPTVFGQVLGGLTAGGVNGRAAVYGLGFGVLDLVFVVLLNDWGDREVDAQKRRMFPNGCSPKTIPDGILPASRLLAVGSVAGALALGLSVVAAVHLDRPHLPWLAFACLALFVAYTLPPLRLNYRGGGELLEMLGVGVALPLFQAYIQSGELVPELCLLLPGYALLSLASAVASGLSDEESDRAGGKRTVATRYGNGVARAVVEGSVVLGAVGLFVPPVLGWVDVPAWAVAPAAAVMVMAFRSMRQVSPAAVTNAFAPQAKYKAALHRASWHGVLVYVVGLLVGGVAR